MFRKALSGVSFIGVASGAVTTLILQNNDDVLASGGATASSGNFIRSGNPGQHSVVAFPPNRILAPGSTLDSISFSYRYISGYGPEGREVGTNFSLMVGGTLVYSSPHYTDYPYDSNHSNYSKPVQVDLSSLSLSIPSEGEHHLELRFANNDRNLQLLLPMSVELTCAGDASCVAARSDRPCDIYLSANSPCVAAHSVVRSLYANYTGSLYRVIRDSDKAALDIDTNVNGFANTDAQDRFCEGTSCYTVRIFDQSPEGNHLDTAPAGGACRPAGGGGLKPVNATKEQISIGGNSVYGAYFEGGQGYRNDVTSGVATGEGEETMYMVTRGDHVNGGCCFDYGNAETDNLDDGKGTMEALYFGTSKGWGHGQGDGPWIMADLENGLWAGDQRVAPAPSINYQYVTAMAKGKKGGFALKGGNAQEGSLQTLHEGARPAGYSTMKKQGAIILGIGGDASCRAVGTFYEGAMTAIYTTDAADDAVQANIVAAGYGNAMNLVV